MAGRNTKKTVKSARAKAGATPAVIPSNVTVSKKRLRKLNKKGFKKTLAQLQSSKNSSAMDVDMADQCNVVVGKKQQRKLKNAALNKQAAEQSNGAVDGESMEVESNVVVDEQGNAEAGSGTLLGAPGQ
ncbi:hypothetical protein RI367_000294 [Sorochytrium milnesiophthora]